MRILDLYIGKILLAHIMVTVIVLLGLFSFVSFLDELGDLDRGTYGVFQIVQHVVLEIPNVLYLMFPMAALIGSILGLSVLARDSELIVMRAAGVSVMRIVGSVLKVGGILAFVALIMGELVAPYTETKAIQIKAESIQNNIRQESDFGIWLRDENTYVNIGEVLPDLTLLDVKIFEFDGNNFLRFLSQAEEGTHDNGRWLLKGLKRTQIDEVRSAADEVTRAYWSTSVNPDILNIFRIKPEQLSIWQLNRYIGHLQANKQDTTNFELTFWSKLVTPLATAVMLIMAVPFVFQQVRSGGLGRSLFSGIMIGLGFFILNKAFTYFVPLFGIPPFVGAVLPTALVCAVSIFLIRRIV
ncbi:MAG: LPS export ABC transporter permease LptG [Arenicella sp.]|nr:LPS export ABC transporter permease LptG [bacterium]MDG1905251.1 LPS export ABC transporter permease LptG [Arenicella sp.]HAU69119.1 LPS export ABC transporter permease LptG [Gammaproteobacteria bacterium]